MIEIKSDGIIFKKITGDTKEYYINTSTGDTNVNVDLNNKTIDNLTINNLTSQKIILKNINLETKLMELTNNDLNFVA